MPVNRWLDDKWFRQLTGEMVERADMNVAFSLPDTNGQLLGGPVANSLLTERWRALQDFEPPTSWFVARTSLEELPISTEILCVLVPPTRLDHAFVLEELARPTKPTQLSCRCAGKPGALLQRVVG